MKNLKTDDDVKEDVFACGEAEVSANVHAVMTSQTATVCQKIAALDQYVTRSIPHGYGKASYSLPVCHGIAKTLLMLFPKTGTCRSGTNDASPPPSSAMVNKARKFLKVKVKRMWDTDQQNRPPNDPSKKTATHSLPTMEDLLTPGLFAADLVVYSHLRIRNKEVIPSCLLTKTTLLGVNLLYKTRRMMQKAEEETGPHAHRNLLRATVSARYEDIPAIAAMLVDHNIIPGGPWAIYNVIVGDDDDGDDGDGDNEKVDAKKPSFREVQARLFQA